MNSATMRSPRRVSLKLAVDVDRRHGLFERARQRDADVGVLGFAGAVDDAAHHRDLHLFDARRSAAFQTGICSRR